MGFFDKLKNVFKGQSVEEKKVADLYEKNLLNIDNIFFILSPLLILHY